MSTIILSAANVDDLTLYGDAGDHELILRSYSGWYDSPQSKVDLTERGGGDGAYDIPSSRILYAARTVIIPYRILPARGHDRSRLRALQENVNRLLHEQVTVRVIDSDRDLYACGYVDSIDLETTVDNINREYLTGQITIVCARPELLAYRSQSWDIRSDGTTQGGLQYGPGMYTYWEGEPNNSVSVLVTDTNYGDIGLHYPLSYGVKADGGNICTLTNHGNSRAYPIFTINGAFPDGVDLKMTTRAGSSHLLIQQPITGGTPIVLDTRSQTATRGGTNVTSMLTMREWATVPAMGSMTVALMTAGTGWVTCTSTDTYM